MINADKWVLDREHMYAARRAEQWMELNELRQGVLRVGLVGVLVGILIGILLTVQVWGPMVNRAQTEPVRRVGK